MKSSHMLTTAVFLSACVMLAACGSAKVKKRDAYNAKQTTAFKTSEHEMPGFVEAKKFLPQELIESPYHIVAEQAYNDGFANAYEIESRDYIFVVQGTDMAVRRIYEIEATERARDISTVRTVGGTVVNKTGNFVKTPIRMLKAGAKRTKKVDSAKDALLLVPSGIGEVVGKVGGGLLEMGKTGVGVAKDGVDAARGGDGERCKFTECAGDAGRTLRSAFESVTGTKSRARELHQKLGTDPYSDNHLLQKQINRVAYSKSLTSAGFSVGLGFVPVSAFAAYSTGVGYYNNAEYVMQYTDPDARREKERALLQIWGADVQTVDKLYENEAFTPTTSTQLMQSLSRVHTAPMRLQILEAIAPMKSRYLVDVQLKSLRYMVELQQKGGSLVAAQHADMIFVRDGEGNAILPIAADHLNWSPIIIDYIQDFAALPVPGSAPELHILGTASSRFKINAQALGLKVLEISA